MTSGKREPLQIAIESMTVLQLDPDVASGVEDTVLQLFADARASLRPKSQWLAFVARNTPHIEGKTSWIAFSRDVPLAVIDQLQDALERSGADVGRELGTSPRLTPFARLSDDGLELLVPAALAGDSERTVARGRTNPKVRGYVIAA